MPKNRLIMRSHTSNRPSYMTLNLECAEEPLSEAQLKLQQELKENYDKVTTSLEELVKDHGGKLVCQVGNVNGYQYTLPSNAAQALVKNTPQSIVNINQNKSQSIKLNVLNNANGPQGNIQLLVDSRMGVILGSVAQTSGPITNVSSTSVLTSGSTSTSSATPIPAVAHSQTENYKYTRSGRRTKVLQVQQSDIIEEPALGTRGQRQKISSTHVVTPTTTTPQGVTNLRIKTVNKQLTSSASSSSIVNTTTGTTAPTMTVTVTPPAATTKISIAKPTEMTSIGGILIGKSTAHEQIDESKKNLPDGKEVTFNKMNGGRTFPSLVVVAKPNLRIKDITPLIAQKERTELDMKVKGVLMYPATKFAEWLIQQGLVKAEQHCAQHSTQHHKSKLKLAMYSDQGTFPYSGGYVWISSCCPDRFVSVFSGSIFQGAPYTPTVLLKIIYHWACQTNIQNVISWVKVSNIYVKTFYTYLRSICTAALWDKTIKIGGKNAVIQIGIISLGTTSQDGNSRKVKVKVIGVLDYSTLDLRLRACDPIPDNDKSFKRQFNNILQPLKEWVHADSTIVTDYTIDKSTLQEMGFHNVIQSDPHRGSPNQTSRDEMSNYHIMEYLRKIVPRMFQNTLSLLSIQMIQQFLDELVWREMHGATAARAFSNIITCIAEQTKIESNESLIDRLSRIAADPFKNWSYMNPPSLTSLMKLRKEDHQSGCEVLVPTNNVKHVKESPSFVYAMKPGPRRGRRRIMATALSPESELKKPMLDTKYLAKEKDRDTRNDKIQLQEHYYATMAGDMTLLLREHKCLFHYKCFLCTATMRSNTEVMEHTIGHVPAQVPEQSNSPVCRYCCTAFSSQHQMTTHVTEAHSSFGHSDSDMVVCAICEQKFGSSTLLINHLSSMHCPSEMPYRCETCGYRTSSHKDAIDHYYRVHERGTGLQCPYCLKVIDFVKEGKPSATNVHAFLLHMQRHIMRMEQGRGNKCSRCCLWFNQKSSLKSHQMDLHDTVSGTKVIPYTSAENRIMIAKHRLQSRRFDIESPPNELPLNEKVAKWITGPVTVNVPFEDLSCKECEEDIDEQSHFPGEQKCNLCRYVTCCWRAFKEHQQQIHNERPLTSLVVPSPLINIPLERKMQCSCGYATADGNELATHLIKCNKVSAYLVEDAAPSVMLNSLGLVPKNNPDEIDLDNTKRTYLR